MWLNFNIFISWLNSNSIKNKLARSARNLLITYTAFVQFSIKCKSQYGDKFTYFKPTIRVNAKD